jgi:hypothetical protein
VAFILILSTMPFLVDVFARIIGSGFSTIESFLAQNGTGI